MANVGNVNVTITATDATAGGINSAVSNLSRLGGSFGSVGSIATGVFSGILGANVFRGITNGIGSVISSSFNLNNSMMESKLVGESMIRTIADTEPVGTAAFGGLSKAASQFERTMREIREKESDGLEDYANKVDNIKEKILEAENEIARKKEERLAQEARQLEDLERRYEQVVSDINTRIEDEELSFNERLYDLNNSRVDRLENLEERRARQTKGLLEEIEKFEAAKALAVTQAKKDQWQAQIDENQAAIDEINAAIDAEVAKVQERADHEVQVTTVKHERKLASLQESLRRENEEYDIKLKRITDDAAKDIQLAEETSAKKIENLREQLSKEEEMHKRFLRDIQQAYEDAQQKMQTAGGGGGAGAGRRTLDFDFDFAEPFREMTGTQIDKFLEDVNQRYIDIGIRSPFNIAEIQQFGRAIIQFTGGSVDNMEQLVDIAQSLAAKNPMQGIHGATVSLVELFGSGNIGSLARRFDIPKDSLEGIDRAANASEAIDLLDEALQRSGISLDLVEAKAQTAAGAFGNIVETFNVFLAQIGKGAFETLSEKLVVFNQFLTDNKDTINGWATTLGNIFGEAFIAVIDGIIAFGTGIKNFMDGPGAGLIDVLERIWASVETLIMPLWNRLSAEFQIYQRLIEETIVPSLTRIFEKIAVFWEEIAPELKKTLDVITKWWNENSETILAVLKTLWATIEFLISQGIDIIKMVIKVGLALIRGDWEAIWKALSDYLNDTFENLKRLGTNIWDALGSIFMRGINGIIDKINGFIKGLNKLSSVEVGDVRIGLSIPEIPKLAEGGIVTSPTLAMIGEAGPEAVIPLSKSGRGVGGAQVYINVTGNTILDDDHARTLAGRISEALANDLALQGAFLGR